MRKSLLIVLLFSVCVGFSQTKIIYNQSVAAYKNKDYPLFLKLCLQLDSIRPSHPTFTYNLAAAYSLNGKTDQAISVLRHLILANNTVAFEDDADFKLLQNTTGYAELKALKSNQNNTAANSTFQLSLSEKDLHPEGLIFLDKQKLWLASSIRHHKIVSFDATGECTDWLTVTSAVFSMKTDATQDYLWVSCSAIPEMDGFSKEMEGKAEILKIEIATRKIVHRFTVDGIHVFGDLAIGNNNDVYITDSAAPLIYKISNNAVAVWKDLGTEAFNLQGIAFNANHSKLFVADYLKGIVAFDLIKNTSSWLPFPENAAKKGIDGLVYHQNSLIAIHNGVTPIRIVRYDLDSENNAITGFTVSDHNRESFNEPALATISNDKLYFFANSPWKFYTADFQLDTSKI